MYREKRNFARLALHATASIHKKGQVIDGEVKDLSMKGAFVTSSEQLEINDRVAVTIYHTLTPQPLCDLEAKVVRVTDKGMGLHFEKSLLD